MSDFDDELLELVEAGSEKDRKRKRSKTKASSSKRRKADDSDEEAPDMEEEEDPYPLEGKYVDEADMQRLMQLSEIEREDIIATRLEEKQKIQDKRAISQMIKEQRGDLDSVSKAAKRQHTARGATKEKSRKLDELKARRKAKDEKSRNRNYSPKRERSSSPMDMETSDEDEEDGMITKDEQEEERERRLYNKPAPVDEEPAKLPDLESVRLSRNTIVKHCMAPWFEQYIIGTWVRYLIGQEGGEQIYRMCQVTRLGESIKPYKIENIMFDKQAELAHGNSTRLFNLDKVSNSPFLDKEFARLTSVVRNEKGSMPTKSALEAKAAEMKRLVEAPITESDISKILERKSKISSHRPPGWTTLERSRLTQARTLAQRRQDYKEVEEIDAKLAEFDAMHGTGDVNGSPGGGGNRHKDTNVLAILSEKNRKANAEAVRRAEQHEAERRRKERKLALSGKSGTATPTDPSARLRILPRTFNAATPSRAGTPASPSLKPQQSEVADTPPPLVPATNGNAKSFEASVIASIEVDLGDF